MGHIIDSTPDNTPRPGWRAACDACGWSTTAPTYAAAGEAARAHGDACPMAATVVEAARDELLCARCAPHADDAFRAGLRAGRRLERGQQ